MHDTFSNEVNKLSHPNYKIMELKGEALKLELQLWTRMDLISWLSWNDRNGIYSDEQSLLEFENILSKEEAIEIMFRQITENQ